MRKDKHKRVNVVFGGTFDPFTAAHKRIVEKLHEKFKDEIENPNVSFQVIIAPSTVSWHRKDKEPFLDYGQRLSVIYKMLSKVLVNDMSYYDVWPGEFDRAAMLNGNPAKDEILKRRGFIDTMQDIMANYTPFDSYDDYEWYFVIGSDQLKLFKQWKNWKELLSIAKMIVVQGRNGETVHDCSGEFQYDEIFIEPKYQNESASSLREQWRDKGYEAFYDYVTAKYCLDEHVYDRYKTPIFKLVQGPEVMPGFAPYKVVAPDWVTVMAEKDGKLLMVKQLRYGVNKELAEFPCGQVENGEPPVVAAYREFKEETGLELKSYDDMLYCGTCSPNPAFMTNHMHYFYVNLDKAEHESVGQQLDEHEKLTAEYMDKDKVRAEVCADTDSSAMMLNAVRLLQNLGRM